MSLFVKLFTNSAEQKDAELVAVYRNRKGLDLPIAGEPEPVLEEARPPRRVALLGADYPGMKPTMRVQPGDAVRRGQVLFEDKKTPGVLYTAPAGGRVVAVHRGAKRAFLSVVIELSAAEMSGGGDEVSYSSYTGRPAGALDGDAVRALLLESGMWTALRARPFGKVADPATRPHSIFVTAMDTNPLAPALEPTVEGRRDQYRAGLMALTKLTDGPVHVCLAPGSSLDVLEHDRVRTHRFRGPHPAGTPGWHIHRIDPVDRRKIVWYAGIQDVVAIGHLFRTGRLFVDRVVSLAGPGVRRPRLLRTRLGASLDDLVRDELLEGPMRVISGSVLSGRAAAGQVDGYLGRYDQQVSVVREGGGRRFLGWLSPGRNLFSVTNTFLSRLQPGKRFDMDTDKHGSDRAIVPIGVYEKVFPFDIPPTVLLRSLAVHDLDRCEELGCLELVEEDLALCSFVDPGKNEFGPHLREVLTMLEREG